MRRLISMFTVRRCQLVPYAGHGPIYSAYSDNQRAGIVQLDMKSRVGDSELILNKYDCSI